MLRDTLYNSQSTAFIQMLYQCGIQYSLPQNISVQIAGGGVGYYRQIDRRQSKGTYVVITGSDHNGAMSYRNFTQFLISQGYDVISIDGRYGREITLDTVRTSLSKIKAQHQDLRLTGVLLEMHGSVKDDRHHVRLGSTSRVPTGDLFKCITRSLEHDQSPVTAISTACKGGAVIQEAIESSLPAGSEVLCTASADESGYGAKLPHTINPHLKISEQFILGRLLNLQYSSTPHYRIIGEEEMGNLRSIAISLLKDHQGTFSSEVIEDIVTQMSILAPEKETAIREVLNRLLQDPQSLEAYHYNSFESIGGQRVNMYNMALAIMYYAHTHHLKDASITSSKEVITPNAAKGLAKLSMTGDGAAVQALLDSGVDATVTDDLGRTALMLAALHSRKPGAIKALLGHRVIDVNARDSNGKTALMLAARFSKNPDVVKVLLRDKRIDVNARDNNGKTVLMHLSKHSSPEIVILLLQKGAELKSADLEKVGFANIETQEDLLRQMVRRLPSETKDQGVFRMLKAYLLNVTAQDDGFIDDMIGKIKDGGMSSEIECVKKELHEERLLKLAQEWGQDIADATLFLRDREVTTTFSATPSSDTSHDASVMCETTLTRADLAMAQSEDLAMTSPCPPVIEGIDVVSRALQPKQTRAITIQERLTKLLENKGFDKRGATLLSSIITTRIMEAPSEKQSELATLSARYINNTVGSEQRKVTPRALKAIGKDELMARCRKIVDSAEHVIDLQLASAERAP